MIVRKLLVSDGRSEREIMLVGTIVVGRDPSCQLNDLDPLLSRRHAEFVPTGKGVTVRDLKSRNGILVNGDKVPERVLKPGDVIQLGHLHVRYVEEAVVKSPEDHSRVRAKTETGIEVPTMAPLPKANPAPAIAAMAADAPTAAAPAIKFSDDTDLDLTVAPAGRSAAAPVRPAPSESTVDDDLDATVAPVARSSARPPAREEALVLPDIEELDLDTTVAPPSRPVPSHAAAPPARHDEDTTRVPSLARGSALAHDRDATVATAGLSLDETRIPAGKPHATAASTEARIVANMNLVVTEASPSCQTVIGARPDTIVGGQLSDAIARGLRFVATGDGPPALSLSIARASSGNTITVTFKTGQATERHS